MNGFRFAKPLRRRLAGLLILAMVSVQMATAAYTCAAPPTEAMPDPMAAMDGCSESAAATRGMMDPEQPGLCFEHCNGGGGKALQPSSNAQLGVETLPTLAYVLSLSIAAPRRDRPVRRSAQPHPTHSHSPPHSIVHCCYRI